MNNASLWRILNEYSALHDGIGLQATVILPTGDIWSAASGYAELRDRCPMSLRHHLYIGSITKLYTAVLMMQQVQQGSLSLDQKIEKWIPLPDADRISVRTLLSHRSGLPDYAWDPWFDIRYLALPAKSWSSRELLDVIRTARVRFEPGTRYEYSNSNYLVLGMILEQLTGKPYEDLLRERIAERLGLHDTYFVKAPGGLLVASGYDESLLHLGRQNVSGLRASTVSGAFAAGGILSTSDDVARFARLLFEGQILNPSVLMQMTDFAESSEPQIPGQTGYGLGVRRLRIGQEELIGHTGTILGYSGIALHSPERDYTIVVLSNVSAIDPIPLVEDIQTLVRWELEH